MGTISISPPTALPTAASQAGPDRTDALLTDVTLARALLDKASRIGTARCNAFLPRALANAVEKIVGVDRPERFPDRNQLFKGERTRRDGIE